MTNVRVEGGSFYSLWRKFSREVKKAGILKEAKARTEFSRKCDERRTKKHYKLKVAREGKAENYSCKPT